MRDADFAFLPWQGKTAALRRWIAHMRALGCRVEKHGSVWAAWLPPGPLPTERR